MKKKAIGLVGCVVAAWVAVAFTCGCEGGGSSGGGGGGGGGGAAAGTWRGLGTDELSGTDTTTLKLTQNGNAVQGKWDGKPVSGILEGSVLTLNLKPFTDDGVLIVGSMSGTVNGDVMDLKGVLTGSKQGVTIKDHFSLHVTRTSGGAAGVLGDEGEALQSMIEAVSRR